MVLVVVLGSSACGDDGPTISVGSPATTATSVEASSAEQYCTDQGGILVPRVATWNTNADPAARLELAGRATFCEFESDEETPSRIAVDLVTLYSEQPTIAAVAYLSTVSTSSPEQVGPNPAEFSCSVDYAATAAFGNTATVGGWVSMCVFPDLSAIDAFGLWYHANGEIRGTDLADVLRYDPDGRLPAMFD